METNDGRDTQVS